ncbi:MAG: response regulator [Thermoguttaceae bacterium]
MQRSIDPPKRVLLVDDAEEICKSWAEVLESEGWTVEQCYDGEAVKEKVESFDPTVVVLDLRMPKRDGIDVLRDLRSLRPWTNVVIVTGHGEEEDAIECLNEGAFHYLKKAVSNQDLIESCDLARQAVPETLLAFHHWYNALPDPDRVVYQSASSGSVSGRQLMEEIKKQTPIAREFLELVAGTAAELVMKRL